LRSHPTVAARLEQRDLALHGWVYHIGPGAVTAYNEASQKFETPACGSFQSRPALNKLLADANKKKFAAVLVWKLDRFGRSLQQLIENVRTLNTYRIRFLAVTQNIDSDQRNPMGQFLLHLFGALAEFERGLTLERVRAGIAEAKRQGKHCGRPKRVFRRDEALKLRSEGLSWRAIAQKLGVPTMTIVDAVRKVPPATRELLLGKQPS
jgi:DNA invertase Pin-like site-specific DNA recombinase